MGNHEHEAVCAPKKVPEPLRNETAKRPVMREGTHWTRYEELDEDLVREDKGDGARAGRRSAALLVAGLVVGTRAVFACLVATLARKAVTSNLDCVIQLVVGGGRVLEDGDPSAATSVSNANVERGKVTHLGARSGPLACLLVRDACRVDIVLSAGLLAEPVVVLLLNGTGDILGLARLGIERNSLRLGAYNQKS